ncbi:MAG: phosphomannomutase/phosphoglucomutase, partial [Clostridia bacterium]|nr:phosphomannomutase/phosphoglucomutase [Clostridia bacterium]
MREQWLSLRSGSDIRGLAIAGHGQTATLTAELASCVGYAFALWLAKAQNTTPDKLTIAVGRDPRLHGEALKRALIGGLTAADCDVLDCGLTTTPALCTLSLGE